MEEVWKDIKGYEGLYQISNLGRVKSTKRHEETIMSPPRDKVGYTRVSLLKDGYRKTYLVHRLVAEMFIPNPDNKKEVDHIDTDPTNNVVTNLRWVSPSENQFNELTYKRKCRPIIQFDINGYLIRKWDSLTAVQKELGITKGNISSCLRGASKTSGGYMWKYFDIDTYCLGKLRNKLSQML